MRLTVGFLAGLLFFALAFVGGTAICYAPHAADQAEANPQMVGRYRVISNRKLVKIDTITGAVWLERTGGFDGFKHEGWELLK